GERTQIREAMAQTGFRAQSGSAFVFSIPAGERFVRLDIRWPDGTRQSVRGLNPQEAHVIRQPQG
ncbi:MAG: ASPIC/UnbV domain-containing protein, partial [Hyphomonadaceae bacterium]